MTKYRDLGAKCLIQIYLARSVIDVIVTANYVGNTHIVIIDNHAEIVSRSSVRALNNEIIKLTVLEFDMTFYQIVKSDGSGVGIAKTDNVRLIRCMFAVIVTAMAVITGL